MIRLTLDDVLYNAAVLGLTRIFDHAELSYSTDGQTIEFPESNLENFSEHYFSYLIEAHGHETNYAKIVELNVPDVVDKNQLEQLNRQIDYVKEILTSNSYKNTYGFLKDIPFDFLKAAKKLKKIRLKKKQSIDDVRQEIDEMSKLLTEIIKHLRHPLAKRHLVPRILSYNVIQGFWTGVSILHKQAHKKEIYKTYDDYFTKSAMEFLEKKKDKEKSTKNKFHCATCENTMTKINEAFDLTWLQKVGVDSARKSSHYWDHQRDTFICPVCNLVYSCLPFGFRTIKGKGFFINNNRSVKEMISVNSVPFSDGKYEVTMDELESMTYYKIIDFIINQAEMRKEFEIENIQIVKYDKDKGTRPYTFNILSRKQMQVLVDGNEEFQKLVGKFFKMGDHYFSLYQEVIERLYKGQNFNDLLYRLMHLVINGEYKDTNSIYNILKIVNLQYKGGIHYMSPEELIKVRNIGFMLKMKYNNQESKINGISHRLSNALKVKNPSKFMETLIQAYSYKNESIPTVFVEILNDEKKFQTIGYAFLVGLHGYEAKKDKAVIKEEE